MRQPCPQVKVLIGTNTSLDNFAPVPPPAEHVLNLLWMVGVFFDNLWKAAHHEHFPPQQTAGTSMPGVTHTQAFPPNPNCLAVSFFHRLPSFSNFFFALSFHSFFALGFYSCSPFLSLSLSAAAGSGYSTWGPSPAGPPAPLQRRAGSTQRRVTAESQ